MTVISLKPELRTSGGETVSIYCDNDWAGDVYLVYREGDMLTGTVQIDTGKVSERNLDYVMDEVRTYISHLTAALGIATSSVVMMYGDIEQILQMEPQDIVAEEDIEGIYDDDLEADENEYAETVMMEEDEALDEYSLDLIEADGEHAKYHLLDDFNNVIGLVAVDEIEDSVSGRVDFWVEPDKDEPEEVAGMLFQIFEDDHVNSISFTMNYEDSHIGDMHLERRDYM